MLKWAAGDLIFYCASQEFGLFISLLWSIWNERNRVLHGGKEQEPLITLEMTVAGWEEFLKLCETQNCDPKAIPRFTRWTAPTPGRLKLNVTATTNPSTNIGEAGCVLRGADGEVYLSAMMPLLGANTH